MTNGNGNGKPGRKPIANRDEVRTTHVTIKMSALERALLLELVRERRAERDAKGEEGSYTVSAYVRDLVKNDARRKKHAKKRQPC